MERERHRLKQTNIHTQIENGGYKGKLEENTHAENIELYRQTKTCPQTSE